MNRGFGKRRRLAACLLFLTVLSSCSVRKVGDSVTPDVPATVATQPPATEPAVTVPPVTEPTPPAEEPVSASLLFCGDNIIYKGNLIGAHRGLADGVYDFTRMYARVADAIAAADLAYINQETLMCGEGYALSYYPQFNSPQQVGLDLLQVGFDVIGIANNHMADKGAKGLRKTIAFWNSVTDGTNTVLVGGYLDAADYDNIRVIEKNGIRIAFLAYTAFTNLKTDAASPVLPVLDKATCLVQICAARAAADLVVVLPHWGEEDKMTPSASEREWAQFLADAGADLIVGNHPHVIQPIEYLTASDGRKTLCAYALGNFIAEQAYDYNVLGGMLELTVVKTGSRVTLEDVTFVPTVCHFDNKWDNVVYYLSDYTDALGRAHAVNTYYDNGAVQVDKLISYLKKTISGAFLPEEYR